MGIWGRLGAPGPRGRHGRPTAGKVSEQPNGGRAPPGTNGSSVHSFIDALDHGHLHCAKRRARPSPCPAPPSQEQDGPTPLPGPSSHLSGFPGSRSRRRHLLAEWISSSFTRMSRCRARHQSWATVMLRFWGAGSQGCQHKARCPREPPSSAVGAHEERSGGPRTPPLPGRPAVVPTAPSTPPLKGTPPPSLGWAWEGAAGQTRLFTEHNKTMPTAGPCSTGTKASARATDRGRAPSSDGAPPGTAGGPRSRHTRHRARAAARAPGPGRRRVPGRCRAAC